MYKKILILLLAFFLGGMSSRQAMAGAHYTLTEKTGSHTIDSSFSVIIGIDSGIDKIIAGDLVMTFDSQKLQITSVEKVASPAMDFFFDSSTPKINNTEGKFEMTIAPNTTTINDSKVAIGDLLRVNFKANALGEASLNFTCQAQVYTDTNIVDGSSVDIVDCVANDSGVYSITAADGSIPTSTPTPISDPENPEPTLVVLVNSGGTPTQLPQTGMIDSTIGLVIFGLVGIGFGVVLKFL